MIDESRTLEIYGYTSDSLSYGSKKLIVAVCEDCGKYREIAFRGYYDLCKSCGHKRQYLSDETRKKMSKTHTGKNHSNETKKKISEAHIGKRFSEEHKKKLSKANIGKRHTHETRQKMSEAQKGIRLSEETKQKLSKAQQGMVWPEERRRKQSARRQNIPYEEWESYACESPYCPRFNEVCRESNREKYGRRCFICGRHESENITSTDRHIKLSVHHADMQKDQGCNGIRWKLVPVCMMCHIPLHDESWKSRIEYLLKNVWS